MHDSGSRKPIENNSKVTLTKSGRDRARAELHGYTGIVASPYKLHDSVRLQLYYAHGGSTALKLATQFTSYENISGCLKLFLLVLSALLRLSTFLLIVQSVKHQEYHGSNAQEPDHHRHWKPAGDLAAVPHGICSDPEA